MRSGVVGGLLVAVVLAVCAATPASSEAADRDCSDFSTQAQAQSFFIAAGGPSRDPHRLDADGDGRACEALPCPCAGSGGGNGKGKGKQEVKKRKVLRAKGRVTNVVDGDTIDVRLKGRGATRVRLIGIDTPEVYGGASAAVPRRRRR